jgi:valyl-tRNA synthetase
MKYKEIKELDAKYDAVAIENRCLQFWENQKTYQYDKSKSREETFVIDTPPPTVSGSLHIGHIFSYTQTDIFVFKETPQDILFITQIFYNHILPSVIYHIAN